MIAGSHAPGLQSGGVALGLLVEHAPGDDVFATTDDERDGGVALCSALEATEE